MAAGLEWVPSNIHQIRMRREISECQVLADQGLATVASRDEGCLIHPSLPLFSTRR